jgi:hypothetical protein
MVHEHIPSLPRIENKEQATHVLPFLGKILSGASHKVKRGRGEIEEVADIVYSVKKKEGYSTIDKKLG